MAARPVMIAIVGWVGFALGGFIVVFSSLQLLAGLNSGGYQAGQATTIAIGAAICYAGLRTVLAGRRTPARAEPPEE
jgi:hypothetical protein